MNGSDILKESTIVLDGFTGFTPVQMELIRKLMTRVESMTFVFTIDASQIGFTKPKDYELFRLTKETVQALVRMAGDEHVDILENVVMCQDCRPYRFEKSGELAGLENIASAK